MLHAGLVTGSAVELGLRLTVGRAPPAAVGAWLVDRLPRLGMTFVKLGQLASTRPDVFGEDVCASLKGLRDRVAPMTLAEVQATLIREHPRGAELAARMQSKPVASASIGQVHLGRLPDGRQVAIKVRRPGIADSMHADVELLESLVRLREACGAQNTAHARRLLRDMASHLSYETNFVAEASNLRRFRKLLRVHGPPGIVIPRTVDEYCCESVLVMEYAPSTCLLQLAPVAATTTGDRSSSSGEANTTGRRVATTLMDGLFAQIFHLGLVHGDPHPGNLGLLPDGQVVMYDFGNVIDLTTQERYVAKVLIWQLILGDVDGAAQSLQALGAEIDDYDALRELLGVYRAYAGTLDVALIRDSHDPEAPLPVRLPDKLMRLLRACSMLEGTCKRVDPAFNYVEYLWSRVDDIILDETFLWRRAQEDVGSWLRGMFHSHTT